MKRFNKGIKSKLPQDEELLCHSGKVTQEDCFLSFTITSPLSQTCNDEMPCETRQFLEQTAFNDQYSSFPAWMNDLNHSSSEIYQTDDSSFYEVKLTDRSYSTKMSRRTSFTSGVSRLTPDYVGNAQKSVNILLKGLKLIDEMCLGPLFFSWCESPNAIYLQTADMRKEYRALMGKMQQHYEHNSSTDSRYFEIGCMCAVFCEETWWRAQLTDNDAYPTCKVLLLDCGFQRTVNAFDIRPLEDEFEKYGKLMYRVSLKGIYPSAGKVWGKDVSRFITERLLGGDDILIRYNKNEQTSEDFLNGTLLYRYDLEPGPLQYSGKTTLYLNDELVSVGLAATRPTFCSLKPVVKLTKWKPPTYPTPGETFYAKVTWVNMEGDIFLHDVRDEQTLEKISDWLTTSYKNTVPTEADMNPKPGDICIAKYDKDNKWYRCVVQALNPKEGTATLMYEDYGTKDATNLCDIRLNVAVEEKPLLALRCKLYNLKPIGDSWDWDTLTKIHCLIVDHEFSCRVVSNYPTFTVILSRKGRSLATELFEKGLADNKEAPPLRSKKDKDV